MLVLLLWLLSMVANETDLGRRSATVGRRADVRGEDNVLGDDDVHAKAGPDLDGWLDGKVLLRDRLAGLVDCAAGVCSPELWDRRVVARDVALAALGGRGHERAQSHAGDDSPPVVVHLVGEAGLAGEVD